MLGEQLYDETRIVDIRCPIGPQKLFLKLRLEGNLPQVNQDLNVMELACFDCKRALRKEGQLVEHVLHRYNIVGELIETVVVDSGTKEL